MSTLTSISSSASRLHPPLCYWLIRSKRRHSLAPPAPHVVISWVMNVRNRTGTLLTFASFALSSPLMFTKLFLLIFGFFALSHHLTLPHPHPHRLCSLWEEKRILQREIQNRLRRAVSSPPCRPGVVFTRFANGGGNKYEFLAPFLTLIP